MAPIFIAILIGLVFATPMLIAPFVWALETTSSGLRLTSAIIASIVPFGILFMIIYPDPFIEILSFWFYASSGEYPPSRDTIYPYFITFSLIALTLVGGVVLNQYRLAINTSPITIIHSSSLWHMCAVYLYYIYLFILVVTAALAR